MPPASRRALDGSRCVFSSSAVSTPDRNAGALRGLQRRVELLPARRVVPGSSEAAPAAGAAGASPSIRSTSMSARGSGRAAGRSAPSSSSRTVLEPRALSRPPIARRRSGSGHLERKGPTPASRGHRTREQDRPVQPTRTLRPTLPGADWKIPNVRTVLHANLVEIEADEAATSVAASRLARNDVRSCARIRAGHGRRRESSIASPLEPRRDERAGQRERSRRPLLRGSPSCFRPLQTLAVHAESRFLRRHVQRAEQRDDGTRGLRRRVLLDPRMSSARSN